MKKIQKFLGIILCFSLLAISSIPANASQFGTEVAVVVRYIDYATGDEVYVGIRGTDSEGNSVFYVSEKYESRDEAYALFKSFDRSNVPTANFQIDNGEKMAANYYDGASLHSCADENDETFYIVSIRCEYYYNESYTSTWTPDTTITVSDVEIPYGYSEVEESGTYTVTFGEENYNQVQAIMNGTMEDTHEAIYIYVDVVITDGTEIAEEESEIEEEATNEESTSDVEESEVEGSSFPSFVIPVGIAAVVIAGGYIYFSNRKKKNK